MKSKLLRSVSRFHTGPLSAPAEGREIEGRTPPDFSGVGKEGERMRQLIERQITAQKYVRLGRYLHTALNAQNLL